MTDDVGVDSLLGDGRAGNGCRPRSLLQNVSDAPASEGLAPEVAEDRGGATLCTGSLQVAASPCWEMVPPDVISMTLV